MAYRPTDAEAYKELKKIRKWAGRYVGYRGGPISYGLIDTYRKYHNTRSLGVEMPRRIMSEQGKESGYKRRKRPQQLKLPLERPGRRS